jgi:DNA-directed RNA polymerase specialized sigma24 family protein
MTKILEQPVTDSQLASRVKDGDQLAALELFLRYEPHISHLAARHGTAVAFDREDVRQECFIHVVHAAVKAVEENENFARIFVNLAGNAVADEASKYRHPVPIPLTTFRRVHDAVKKLGSPAAAREYLAAETGWYHVSHDVFDSVWLLAFGVHLEWSGAPSQDQMSYADVIADPGTPSAFASIENQDYTRYLLDLLAEHKGPQYREVVARMFGLDGFPAALFDPRTGNFIPATSKIVAAEMGIHDVTVRRIWAKARAFLTIHAEEF